MRSLGLSIRMRALLSWARSAVRSARFVAVTTRKARGRPKLFVLTLSGRKFRERFLHEICARRSRAGFFFEDLNSRPTPIGALLDQVAQRHRIDGAARREHHAAAFRIFLRRNDQRLDGERLFWARRGGAIQGGGDGGRPRTTQ